MASISGGAKLQRALDDIARRIGKGGTLNVGFLEGATYPGGEDGGEPTSVAEVALAQNFGTARGIPPRPFFTNMVKDQSPGWGGKLEKVLKANDYDVPKALALMGEGIKGQLQQSILNTNDPPLAESTIKAKGFDKPLIHTSNMINSVDYEVEE